MNKGQTLSLRCLKHKNGIGNLINAIRTLKRRQNIVEYLLCEGTTFGFYIEKLDLRCYIVKLRIQGCRYWV